MGAGDSSVKTMPVSLVFPMDHPDHSSLESLSDLENTEILLANHVGGRIYRDLTYMGFKTRTLPERRWFLCRLESGSWRFLMGSIAANRRCDQRRVNGRSLALVSRGSPRLDPCPQK